ncbi:glucose-6-phosphate isomerase [Acetobacteroides hydrogenigenes]|uniref:Glucose-6-phosphate isomerase n=1 Tax=Acetobacteroides hydrogenigenes TaxID=979970 RepID=A0A4V2RQX6_9BACT|nr:glucose-6-phosphate isomerase [Acetobacteroides hydrogenigenes]TCN73271.1 glucose-6-phosphate isomerase [Acetobacteroides hydrogenigenes]
MVKVNVDLSKTAPFVAAPEIEGLSHLAKESNKALHNGTGKGNDFLGWVNLPFEITNEHILDIKQAAATLSKDVDVVVVIGIGGSYLGAKAVIDALSNSFSQYTKGAHPHIVYAGQNIGEEYHAELLDFIKTQSVSCIVISKSGTTTEPAIAFRLIKQHIEEKYGKEEAKRRIVAITDESKGALRQLADTEGYKTFVIPDNVGGRYSVLTPVGLLPISVAGFDIAKLVEGARLMAEQCKPEIAFAQNPAEQYATIRNVLYKKGKKIEMLVNFNSKLHFMSEWWKQLYGESEGKENKGIFPAAADFSTDLHSMGQYIQEGERILFETFLGIENVSRDLRVPMDKENLDMLNFLADKHIDDVNKMAELGTILAHIDGGVPAIRLGIEKVDETNLGSLIYFFEKACGISGYMLGVNPFNQPGVEAYKANMFALLDKPGFEEEGKKLRARL